MKGRVACLARADGFEVYRRGIIYVAMHMNSILQEPRDLASFKAVLMARTSARVALTHFDLVPHRSCYDVDLFATLRYLIMDVRKLTLLVESHTAFGTLLPRGHPLSDIDIATVEVKAQP